MALPLIASIAGGAISALGARSAARTQASASRDAARAQERATNRTNAMLGGWRTEDMARLDPFARPGIAAQNALAFETGVGARPDGYQGFTATPGYDFRLRQGEGAVARSVAGQQGLLSGAAGKALTAFNQDFASNEYGNFLARLGGLAANGQQAVGMQSDIGQRYGNAIAGNIMQAGQANAQGIANAGNARASGAVGVANAFNALGENLVGNWQNNRMMNAFSRPAGTASTTPAWNTGAFWTGNF
jgi:hypothetical protein